MLKNKGVFYVVSTPIGNLNDISLRAIEILKQVNTIYAEDTRKSATLLHHFNISSPMRSCHSHNEAQTIAPVLAQLSKGENIALISDAGTPILSDPGFLLAKAVEEAGFKLVPIPGASALLAAIVASGLNCTSFSFLGFLSSKRQLRIKQLKKIKYAPKAQIIYEAPHRLLDFLQDALDVFGEDRKICLARELTKVHETFVTKTTGALVDFVKADKNQQRGELVLIIDAFDTSSQTDEDLAENFILAENLLPDLLEFIPPAKVSAILAKSLNLHKKQIYDLALKISTAKRDKNIK